MEAVKEMESVEKIQAINKTSWMQRMKSYKRTPLSFVLWLLVNVAMIATVAVLAYLIVYILVNGVPYLNSQLFELKYTSENASVFPAIINTLIMTVLSLVLAVPLGIFAAIYCKSFGMGIMSAIWSSNNGDHDLTIDHENNRRSIKVCA